MKKILITGANSYIGMSFENFMRQYGGYRIDTVDMIDGSWRNKDFSEYDAVFHVAGIAHADVKNVSEEEKKKYYVVNTDLTIETAEKAKNDGAGQFVFMSSMIVFGSGDEFVTKDTVPNPDNFYGDSKLRADVGIHKLESENFKVVSIRPPMIYGRGSRGNYPLLAKFAKTAPIFPKYDNKRSMLYIENLCGFVKMVIDNEENGYFYPQNREYVNTSELVKEVSEAAGKHIHLTGIFNPIIRAAKNNGYIRKIFGNRCYDTEMSNYRNFEYCVCDFKESVKRTES